MKRKLVLAAAVTLAACLLLPLVAVRAAPAAEAPSPPEVVKWAFISAAVGGAAMGAVAEKPETAGRALLFVGLAEGIAIYGLIVAIMILGRLR
jgi:V/A-type H+/Na+-transporting ATPase subunit K